MVCHWLKAWATPSAGGRFAQNSGDGGESGGNPKRRREVRHAWHLTLGTVRQPQTQAGGSKSADFLQNPGWQPQTQAGG